MSTLCKTIDMSDNRTLKIFYDENPESPREWDNLGTMVCFHSRYNLGDKHEFQHEVKSIDKESGYEDYYMDDPKGLLEFLDRDDVISLPLYLYDHSIQSISTQSWIGRAQHAEWDSGKVGYIYVTKETIREQYDWKVITKQRLAKVIQHLKNEVKTYDDYMTGNVYGYILECAICEKEIDSCWGFYGDSAIQDIQTEVQDYDCEDCHAVSERLDKVLA